MLDRDLAKLYEVETKNLKRQVDRNMERFPSDFMFELNVQEFIDWRRQFGTSNISVKMGLRYAPYAFTEPGIAMLSSVLNSTLPVRIFMQKIFCFRIFKIVYTACRRSFPEINSISLIFPKAMFFIE